MATATKQQTAYDRLASALDYVSWEWLETTHPELAGALQELVEREADPREIRRFVMSHTQRWELALRCEQAARHLSEGGE